MPHPDTNLFSGGNASIYVTDMDRAVRFYTETLGLRLKVRIANEWAELDAGEGLVVGLHPANAPNSAAGTRGAINLELKVTGKLDDVVKVLQSRGVRFDGAPQAPIQNYENVRLATLLDPDDNAIVIAQILHSGT